MRDTIARTTRRISLDPLEVESNQFSSHPEISADGRYVVFYSRATNLVSNDINSHDDIFIRANPNVTIRAVSPDHLPIGATTSVTVFGTSFLPGAAPFVNGAQISDIVVKDSRITMNVTIPANSTAGARNLGVSLLGTGAGPFTGSSVTCENCVTYQ